MSHSLAPAVRQHAGTLYRDHHRWLLGWLRSRLGCPERAADFAHDTFYRVLTRPRSEPVEQPRAFLTRIATRLMIDESRRSRLERAWLEAQAAFMEEHGTAPSPADLTELLDTLETVARLLEGLPDKPRRAFLMSRLDGLPQADIAAALGVTVSMVKKYLARALLHCHRALQDDTP
ncbi:sigma-70 family RNA polymerase sigma factor [Aquisalimonas asiatica]|uniref:RNA polymerase sigma-70 factor, ECF subfamily n=1 Tax=Aquisalimonas asiatica TaxID=406100 RepID=A0A1H8SY87_9GAMM|nr:sigma-70 family RNA polymerase sigma factor [Aquisalimonas asiatica]SEO83607.1 RNA polymerase sigma-70 factor, ECF subfamily [Aquisalimonas asiatica]